jgi:hypothetical protein
MTYPNILETGETKSHAFVIKIWPEESGEVAGQTSWRGRITHVPSGSMSPLQELHEITDFITPYLATLGVKPTIRERVTRWAQGLRGHPLEEEPG